MKMKVINRETAYEIGLSQISQWCGQNLITKTFIVDSMCKYFSNAKYAEYEEHLRDNVFLDGEQVGRKYYEIFRISDRETLLNAIKIGKTTLLNAYLKLILSEYEFQEDMNALDNVLVGIYGKLNLDLDQIGNIELLYQSEHIWDIIQKSELRGKGDVALETLGNAELIRIYLNLLEQMQKRNPVKHLVMFENIDHMVTAKEYREIYNVCENISHRFDEWFIYTISLDDYVVLNLNNLQGVTIFNDMEYNLAYYEKIHEYIQDHYPCERNLSAEKLLASLAHRMNCIGRRHQSNDVQDAVVCKLLNQSICVSTKWDVRPNSAEIAFMLA